MRRPLTLVLSLLLLAALVPAGPAVAQEPPPPVPLDGTASTSLDLGKLALSVLPPETPAGLAAASTFASGDANAERNTLGEGEPYAQAVLELLGQEAGRAESDGDQSGSGGSEDIPGLGTVQGGALEAVAEPDRVVGRVAGVGADLGVGPLGVSLGTDAGIQSLVESGTALAQNGASLSGLTIDLGDLIPPEIIAQIPFDVLIDALGQVPLSDVLGPLTDALGQGVAALDEAQAGIEAARAGVAEATSALAEGAAELDAAKDEVPGLTAALEEAEDDLDAATQELNDATAGLEDVLGTNGITQGLDEACADPITTALPGVQAACTAYNAARDAQAAAQDSVDNAQTALNEAAANVSSLEAQVNNLQAALDRQTAILQALIDALQADLQALLDQISALDLAALVQDLVDGLAGLELVSVEGIDLGVTARATSGSSRASASCAVTGARILGQDVGDGDCDIVTAALTDVVDTIEDLLADLPVVGGAATLDGAITVEGPSFEATPDDATDGDYFVAEARADGLRIALGEIDLNGTVSRVVSDLTAQVQGILDAAEELGLPPDVGDTVQMVVDELLAQIGALPTGELLSQIPSADIDLLEVTAQASFVGVCTDDVPAPGETPRVERISGAARIETAIEVSRCAFPATDTVVLSRADIYADSLSGAPLAADRDAPILLTPPDALVPEVAAEIRRLGATNVLLLGGTDALNEDVEQAVRDNGWTPTRFGGANRFGTAQIIAQSLETDSDRVFVTLGGAATQDQGFPDALSAAPYAAASGDPILLAVDNDVPLETKGALQGLRPEEIVVIGGDASILPSTFQALGAFAPSVRRIGGADRYVTSAMVFAESVDAGLLDPATVYLARGDQWFDALVAGPAVADAGDSFMLVDPNDLDASAAVRDEITRHGAAVRLIRLIGGPQTIAERVEQQLTALIGAG